MPLLRLLLLQSPQLFTRRLVAAPPANSHSSWQHANNTTSNINSNKATPPRDLRALCLLSLPPRRPRLRLRLFLLTRPCLAAGRSRLHQLQLQLPLHSAFACSAISNLPLLLLFLQLLLLLLPPPLLPLLLPLLSRLRLPRSCLRRSVSLPLLLCSFQEPASRSPSRPPLFQLLLRGVPLRVSLRIVVEAIPTSKLEKAGGYTAALWTSCTRPPRDGCARMG
jgi:hypothetical protein